MENDAGDDRADGPTRAPRPENTWMTSFGTFVGVMATLAALSWMAAESWPGGQFLMQLGVFLVALALGVAWVGLVLTYFILRLRHRPTGGGVGLLVAAAALVVTMAATATHMPLRVRFALSSSAFERVLDEDTDRASWGEPRRIGLYKDASVAREGADIAVWVMDGGFGPSGFVHSADGPPTWLGYSDEVGSTTLALGGGWYAYWQEGD